MPGCKSPYFPKPMYYLLEFSVMLGSGNIRNSANCLFCIKYDTKKKAMQQGQRPLEFVCSFIYFFLKRSKK